MLLEKVVKKLAAAWELQRSPRSEIPWKSQLVGGLEHFLFCHMLGIIIPTD